MNESPFSLEGRVAVITGGYGVLGSNMTDTLARAGARVAVLGRRREEAIAKSTQLTELGIPAMAVVADVLDESSLKAARDRILSQWGSVDILVNAAGGNVARARTDGVPPFDMPLDAFDEVLRLNLHGTVIPSLVFGTRDGAAEVGQHREHFIDGIHTGHQWCHGILCRKGGGRKLHEVAGG